MKECEEMAEALAALIDAEWDDWSPKGVVPCGAASHWTDAQDALTAYRAARRRNEEAVVYPHHDNLDGPCACGAWHKLDR